MRATSPLGPSCGPFSAPSRVCGDGGQGASGTLDLCQSCQRKCARRRARCPGQRRHHAQGHCCSSAGPRRPHPSGKCRLGARSGCPALGLRPLWASTAKLLGSRHLNGRSSMARNRLAWKRGAACSLGEDAIGNPIESRSEHAGRQIGPMVQGSPERRIPWKNQSQSKFNRLTRLR